MDSKREVAIRIFINHNEHDTAIAAQYYSHNLSPCDIFLRNFLIFESEEDLLIPSQSKKLHVNI